MESLEEATRAFAEAIGSELSALYPRTKGAGHMFWDDSDSCIFIDFFGDYQLHQKTSISELLLANFEQRFSSYSLRIGFHCSEEVARKLMLNYFSTES